MLLLGDFETRSRCDLKRHGGRVYAEHPTTEVICFVGYEWESQAWIEWVPQWHGADYEPSAGTHAAFHNATGFDQFIWRRLGWRAPKRMIDTSELARRAGIPGALDKLGSRWLGRRKDDSGSALTKALSAGRGRKGVPPDLKLTLREHHRAEKKAGRFLPIPDEILRRVVRYCRDDVEIIVEGWPLLTEWLDAFPQEERVSRVDRKINERGIYFDQDLARALLREDARLTEETLSDIAAKTGLDVETLREVASSPKQFVAVTGAPNAQKDTIERLIEEEPEGRGLFAQARQALASIARGKLEAGLARVSPDSRLRDGHRYIAAHTWRWGGRGFQHQNMPRPDKRFEDENWGDDDIDALARYVIAGMRCDAAERDLLLRATLCAPEGKRLIVRDFSSVEAVTLAWAAGDYDALQVFIDGVRDVYKIAASHIFNVPYEKVEKPARQVGKVSELACGYGGGPGALEKMAKGMRIDFVTLGVDPRTIVDAWRQLHAPIVQFWDDLENAMRRCIRDGRDHEAGPFTFTNDGDDSVAMLMPNGRPLVYENARFATKRDAEIANAILKKKGLPANRKPGSIIFDGERAGVDWTYGGKLAENAIQSLCREFLADALVRADEAGLDLVMHCHDEAAAEEEEDDAEAAEALLHECMIVSPEYCPGLPMKAAGFVGRRYRK